MSQNKSTPKTGGSTAKKKPGKKAAERQKRLLHRSIRAGIYIFMAFLGVLSLFNVKGFVINWYRDLIGSLIGFGYYLAPLAFLAASVMIIARMKGKVRARETAIFLIPLFFGAIGHIVRDITAYPPGIEGFKLMAAGGRALTSGGLISGSLGMLLKSAFSAGGGIVLCLIAIAACCFVFTGTNPVSFFKKLKPAPEEEDDELKERDRLREERRQAKAKEKAEEQARRREERRRAKNTEPEPENIETLVPPRSNKTRPVFVDFFDKDKPADTPDTHPEKKDPTAPPAPDFTVEEVTNIDPDFDAHKFSSDEFPPVVSAESREAEESHDIDAIISEVKAQTPEVELHTPGTAFDIYTADNPPPAELTLDEKRQASAEAQEKAAEEQDVSGIISDASQEAETGKYIYPPLSLLAQGDQSVGADHESIVKCAERLVDTLSSFNIESKIVNVTKGPTVTRYELQLQRGVKFAKVTSLADDIALSLGAASVRIAPIPANNSVGIEVPNDVQEVVSLRDILQDKSFSSAKGKLSFAVGKDIAGQCVVGDIAKMPHMLIAGTTGSGKSVCINSIIISLIYKSSPEEVRLIMVDPKMIELGMYNGIPHLLIPVVTDPKKAAGALNWAVGEMERRYKLLSQYNVRSLEAYNDEIRRLGEGETLPQIVIVIDELADLMFVAAREVEESIARIAQKARAAGMHLIIATQRPSADVITGLMKANIPSRIAFAVASQIDSRIILDQNGAEKLIGRGDMLYNPLGAGKPMRVQGCFISSKEVESVIEFVKQTGTADYDQNVLDHIERQAEAADNPGGRPSDSDGESDDPLLMDAISVVVDRGEASTSLLQRRLKLGYARAARLIDIMEERGIVGPFEGSKPRSVTLTPDQWSEMQLRMKD